MINPDARKLTATAAAQASKQANRQKSQMLLYGIISFLCTTTTILPYVVFAALESKQNIIFFQLRNTINQPIIINHTSSNCRQHDNCIGLSLCMDGKCTAAIPTDITCEGQEYCYAHQVCRFGVCLESSVLPRSGCLSHADCEGQQLCVKGRCKVALPVGGFCLDNSQCGRMLTCKFNRCWQAVGKCKNEISI
ncbi:hypothetical protein Tsp_03573 [Trichinella spiralis]|uniref:hypothetical protein n=1 Tax=Trichinella spiralis TaxID=6334 RepID=UPI0001EFB80F|nr:hypothetical protein Tsp_03573 [Trichinella spiralis]